MVRLTHVLTIMTLLLFISSCDDDDSSPSGDFKVTIENTGEAYDIINSGNFTTPNGSNEAGPLLPGNAYEVEFKAPKGTNLTVATMFVQSNDWFYANGASGTALYNNGSQVTGDITDEFTLYDAGTEMDQEAGVGDNQAPRQDMADQGPDDSNSDVREVMNSDLPSVTEVMEVTLTSTGDNSFRLRIENVSDTTTLQTSEGGKPVPLSPGVFLVHSPDMTNLLYETGMSDYGDGLESIAEDGDPSTLTQNLAQRTGITVPLSPGVYAVLSGDNNPMFSAGEMAMDNGLEELAEDGSPSMLSTALGSSDGVSESGAFNTPAGADGPGPLLPGQSYSFTFSAEEGDMLTFATMYVQSNDLFYAPQESGISIYEDGSPAVGDVTDQVMLWDAGTEMNEMPGFGHNQAPRQSGTNTGPSDSNSNVRQVNDSYSYSDVISVTIEMQ